MRLPALASTLLVMPLCGCFGDPAFHTGLRVKSTEQISYALNSDFPVPGVTVTGDATGSVGVNNTGTQRAFDGVTGGGGIIDFPNALTDTTWNVAADWTRAIPQCPPTVGQFTVPGRGAVIVTTCIMF